MKAIFNIKIFFVASILFFACHNTEKQPVYGKPPLMPEKNYKSLDIPFTDTTTPLAKEMIKSLDSFYRNEVAKGFNGGVLIGNNGSIIYERYYGYSNYTTKQKWSKNTSSQLASTSKPFTATAILWLQQNNFLNINDPVSDYIPDFPYKNVTIKMCLNHRSGLPDYLNFYPKYWSSNTKFMNNQELIDVLIKHKPAMMFTPNTRFKYCNTNYAVLAQIVEEVTELSFAKFMNDFIFQPLGMTQTFMYDPTGKNPKSSALSYKSNFTIFPDNFADGVYGDKGVFSTLRDMYKWDQSFYNYIFLDKSTQTIAYAPYSFETPGEKNYGLGWRMINEPNNYKIIYHNGWWHGNNTVFYRFIKDNYTIIVLGNKYNTGIYKQVKPIYSILRRYTQMSEVKDLEGGSEEASE